METKAQRIRKMEWKIAEECGVPPHLRREFARYIRDTLKYRAMIWGIETRFMIIGVRMALKGLFRRKK